MSTEQLNHTLRMEKGDVYNQVLMDKRLKSDEDAVGNYYYNSGYVFFNCQPVEIDIVDDSVDVEMRIVEGKPATFNNIIISGNTNKFFIKLLSSVSLQFLVRIKRHYQHGTDYNREHNT